MAISLKKITLWRKETSNDPGVLASVLEPLAESGASLRLLMGYGTEPERAVIELFPVAGNKVTAAAEAAGLGQSSIPCLLIEGEDRRGFGAEMARAIADADVNISFVLAQAIGRNFTAVFGFADDAAATKASEALRAIGRGKGASGAARGGQARRKSKARKASARSRKATKRPRSKARRRR